LSQTPEEKKAELVRQRRARRRQASLLFLITGISFGTALYLLRARFEMLDTTRHRLGLLGLVGIMVLTFFLGARAEAEVKALDEELRKRE
jgi:hypothetical protein